MKTSFLRIPILLLFLLGFNVVASAQTTDQKVYKCIPCGQACDDKTFSQPGECESCHMKLVEASTIQFTTVSPESICAYITSHPDAVLLDVRTAKEYKGAAEPDYGTLKNAINIPIQELEKRLEELQAYKDREIIVFCSHSHRSPQAAYLLTQNGFTNVTNMAGGMSVVTDPSCKH